MTEQRTFEEALEALEKIVQQLEREECSLETTINLYKEGIELLSFCTSSLDKIEKEIIKINQDNDLLDD